MWLLTLGCYTMLSSGWKATYELVSIDIFMSIIKCIISGHPFHSHFSFSIINGYRRRLFYQISDDVHCP